MSSPDPANKDAGPESEEPSSQGPNLALLYGLLAAALVVAIILAAFIVLPFYHRR